jgi:hypothetical protein
MNSVMLACPASFFTIQNQPEGFQTSWNDKQCSLTYELISKQDVRGYEDGKKRK